MTRVIPRPMVTQACIEALREAESTYQKWTGGISMRAAPESFVQMLLARRLHTKLGLRVLLEASVSEIRQMTGDGRSRGPLKQRDGRVDIVAYYKSSEPRFLIELKKLTSASSLKADTERIRQLMDCSPTIQNGLLVAYTAAVKEETVLARIESQAEALGIKRVRNLSPQAAMDRRGKPHILAGAVYRVDRTASAAPKSRKS